MNAVNRIRGFLMKETVTASTEARSAMEMKYFVLGPAHQLYVTSNLALLQYLVNAATSLAGLFDSCERYLKQMHFEGRIAVSDVKPHLQPEKLAFYNSKYFEATLLVKNKPRPDESALGGPSEAKKSQFFMFSFDDDSVLLLHAMMASYHDFAASEARVRELLATKLGGAKDEPETAHSDSLAYKKHLEQYKGKMKLILRKMELDAAELAEGREMRPKRAVEEEAGEGEGATKLVRLDNGSLFAGALLDGLPTGAGKEFLEDGSSYVGEFRDGFWHGLGYLVDSENYICYAEFYRGRVVGI